MCKFERYTCSADNKIGVLVWPLNVDSYVIDDWAYKPEIITRVAWSDMMLYMVSMPSQQKWAYEITPTSPAAKNTFFQQINMAEKKPQSFSHMPKNSVIPKLCSPTLPLAMIELYNPEALHISPSLRQVNQHFSLLISRNAENLAQIGVGRNGRWLVELVLEVPVSLELKEHCMELWTVSFLASELIDNLLTAMNRTLHHFVRRSSYMYLYCTSISVSILQLPVVRCSTYIRCSKT